MAPILSLQISPSPSSQNPPTTHNPTSKQTITPTSMASPLSSSSSLTSASLSPLEPITTEEFNHFHAIDRDLYSRLIFGLHRDPAESMQVMGLWLWLERYGPDSLLVEKILSTHLPVVNGLAEETVACLKSAEGDGFSSDSDETNDIPLLRRLLGNPGLSLRYFHDNRIAVLRGVSKIVSKVCARAFEDIIRQSYGNSNNNPRFMVSSNVGNAGEGSSSGGGVVAPPLMLAGGGGEVSGVANERGTEMLGSNFSNPSSGYNLPLFPAVGGFSGMGYGGLTGAGPSVPPDYGLSSDRSGVPRYPVPAAAGLQFYDAYDLRNQLQWQVWNHEEDVGEMLGRISLAGAGDEKDVPPDVRTIFLTFSKGYPISENEVKEFFVRKFGELIEAIHMQEVPAEEQVLYARLVARSISAVDAVLDGQRTARFSINGKHVWARKYVRKNPKSTPTPQPTASQPKPASSPVTAPPPNPWKL
ncbi:hypothetical protein U1Q18_047401 [Sarracenia purpurea var. burkii]